MTALRTTLSLSLVFALIASVTHCHAVAPLAEQADRPIAQKLERIGLVDFRGRTWKLEDFEQDSLLVFAFLGTECPLAKLYAARLSELQQAYAAKGVRVVAVMSNRQDSLEEIASFAMRQEIDFPILKDAGNRFADDVGATRTPEIFVYDSSRALRYHGRVDDQYGIGYVREEPRRKDLELAIESLLADKPVTVTETVAVGCIIGRQKSVDSDSAVTYGGQVAEILARRCVECHRDGEIAPFSLTDFEEVAGWADMIAETVDEGRMPPWHATSEHATFANDRSMTSEEKEILKQWAEAGAPAGDLSNLPEVPDKVAGWQLPNTPDLVVPVSPQPFNVAATGAIRYQYFTYDPEFEEDKWIRAMELKPGNREVVHHILVFARPKGVRGGIDAARGFLAGYVPGSRLIALPPGYAKRIPAGSELVFQVHYTPIGTPQVDQSQFGLVFADPNSVTHEIVTTSALQSHLDLPPNDANHEVIAKGLPFPADAELFSFSPHMHVRGKAFRYSLQTPDGKRTTLLDIPAYDFNWQTNYLLAERLDVPAGSRMICHAWFDNSSDNLNNPDPNDLVRWGDQTWEEMMIGYYHYAVPVGTHVPLDRKLSRDAIIRDVGKLRQFDKIDRDRDGKLRRDETPKIAIGLFDQLDLNRDRLLTREEVVLSD